MGLPGFDRFVRIVLTIIPLLLSQTYCKDRAHNYSNNRNLTNLILNIQQEPEESWGGYCSANTHCQPPLWCNMERPKYPFCDCAQNTMTWSYLYQQCVSLVGSPCFPSEGLHCQHNADCNKNGHCDCKKDYSAGRDKKCYLRYNATCETNTDPLEACNSFENLVCNPQTHRCDCDFPGQMIWDQRALECRMLIDEPCDVAQDPEPNPHPGDVLKERPAIHNCVEGAQCSARSRTCQCESGLLADPVDKSKCHPGYYALCGKDTDCLTEYDLICLHGRCGCKSESDWDFADNQCRQKPTTTTTSTTEIPKVPLKKHPPIIIVQDVPRFHRKLLTIRSSSTTSSYRTFMSSIVPFSLLSLILINNFLEFDWIT